MSQYRIFRIQDNPIRMEYVAQLECLEAGMYLWTWTEDCKLANVFTKMEAREVNDLMRGHIALVESPPSERIETPWWQKYENMN